MVSGALPSGAADRLAKAELAVVCQVRRRRCALLAADVDEVMRPLPIEPVGNATGFVLGLSVIRGAPTPVVDAGALLGEERDGAPHARFVVVRTGERRVALAVEGVLGVRRLPAEGLVALPPLLRHASDEVVSALGTLDAQLLTVLGNSCLVPPEVWTQLGLAPVEGGADPAAGHLAPLASKAPA